MTQQSTNHVLMIRPAMFNYNIETAKDNAYAQPVLQLSFEDDAPSNYQIQLHALAEFNALVEALQMRGVKVEIIADTEEPPTPDSIFPNNWFSTHHATLVLYPMMAKNRRAEVQKFASQLCGIYQPQQLIDLSFHAENGIALESTGVMIFDRIKRRIYACDSQRCNRALLHEIANRFDYNPILFNAHHLQTPIYHTNVLMAIGTEIAAVGSSLIDVQYRDDVLQKLGEDREIVELSAKQVLSFAGNMLELVGDDGKFWLMSQSAYNSLSASQISQIESHLPILCVNVPTIETLGGGSVRCMVGELF